MKKYLLICMAWAIRAPLLAQTPKPDTLQPAVVVERLPAEVYMKQQVAHLSEFIRRFNGQQTAEGKPIPDSLKATFDRKQAIAQLIDGQSGSESLKKYRNTFLETVSDTTATPLLRHPPQNTWATFELWVSLDGKAPQPVRCTLHLARVGKGYAWQWADAEADFLKSLPKFSAPKVLLDTTAYIAPNAHETAFLDVYNLIKYRKDLRYSTPNPRKPPASIAYLNALVAEGRLTAAYTKPPHLYVSVGKAWVMSLFFQNRNTLNSGWLIEDLYFLPTDQKKLPFKTNNN